MKTEKILRTTLASVSVDHPVHDDFKIFVASPMDGKEQNAKTHEDNPGDGKYLRSLKKGDSLQVGV